MFYQCENSSRTARGKTGLPVRVAKIQFCICKYILSYIRIICYVGAVNRNLFAWDPFQLPATQIKTTDALGTIKDSSELNGGVLLIGILLMSQSASNLHISLIREKVLRWYTDSFWIIRWFISDDCECKTVFYQLRCRFRFPWKTDTTIYT